MASATLTPSLTALPSLAAIVLAKKETFVSDFPRTSMQARCPNGGYISSFRNSISWSQKFSNSSLRAACTAA